MFRFTAEDRMTAEFGFASFPGVPVDPEEHPWMGGHRRHIGDSIRPVLDQANLPCRCLHSRIANGNLHLGLSFLPTFAFVISPQHCQWLFDTLVSLRPNSRHIAQISALIGEITLVDGQWTTFPELPTKFESHRRMPVASGAPFGEGE